MERYWYHEDRLALKCTPVRSFIELSFFKELSGRKLDDFKLSDTPRPLTGLMVRLSLLSKFHDAPILNLDASSFAGGLPSATNVTLRGTIMNLNTIEQFKAIDKQQLLLEWGNDLQGAIEEGKFLHEIETFHVIAFSDLKKFKFYYWVAHPTLHSSWHVLDYTDSITAEESLSIKGLLDTDCPDSFCEMDGETDAYVFFDGCTSRNRKPSSMLLNHLYGLALVGTKSANVIVYRPDQSSFKLRLELEFPLDLQKNLSVTGWERNDSGKLGPKIANLGLLIDPVQMADQAVDLNLKLMKWRVAPALDLDIIKRQRILLLGAGTLGCYVGRALMGWGVRNITFADNGRVSHSNPVRQPLFSFEDCVADNGRGAFKASCAANAMRKIFPGVDSQGEILLVPMIGHLLMPDTEANCKKLHELVKAHDVVFLLLDLREARWLPTVVAKSMGKLVINAALGYDSLMVMRHGTNSLTLSLGCYYCNDVYAPSDSLSDRTLDQMCTVTRPGGAPMASALAVELMVSVLQHPLQNDAPHDGKSQFGSVPHQIRAYLSTFEQIRLHSTRYVHCAACSDIVLDRYQAEGWEFVSRCLESSAFLEESCGLQKVQLDAELAAQNLLKRLEMPEIKSEANQIDLAQSQQILQGLSDVDEIDDLDEEWLS